MREVEQRVGIFIGGHNDGVVDAAEGFNGGGDRVAQAKARVKLAMIELDGFVQRVAGGIDPLLRWVCDEHLVAFVFKSAGNRLANFAAEAQNERYRLGHGSVRHRDAGNGKVERHGSRSCLAARCGPPGTGLPEKVSWP